MLWFEAWLNLGQNAAQKALSSSNLPIMLTVVDFRFITPLKKWKSQSLELPTLAKSARGKRHSEDN